MNSISTEETLSYLATEGRPPYDFYERVRSRGGIAWDDQMKSWIVVDYDLVQTILRDDVTFAHPYTNMRAGDSYLKIRSNNPRSFQFMVGEKHRAFHKWWLIDLLSPRAVKQYRPVMVDGWIDTLVDRLAGQDGFDLVTEFSERVPMGVFAALLDLPRRDIPYLDHIKSLNDAIARFASVANSMQLEGETSQEAKRITYEAIKAAEELDSILAPLVRERSQGTGDDFISKLWAGGHVIFEDWNEVDTLDACRRLLFAGVDTTTHAINNAFYLLLTDEALRRQVAQGTPEIVDRFVEEVFRLDGSVQFRPRRVSRDVVLGSTPVKAGDMLTVAIIGANRDPQHYGCPHQVDLERARPTDHFAFNYGPRTCLGMHLARAELSSALVRMLARFPDIRLDPAAPAPSFEGFLMRSYRPLHVLVSSPMSDSTSSAIRNPSAAAGRPQ